MPRNWGPKRKPRSTKAITNAQRSASYVARQTATAGRVKIAEEKEAFRRRALALKEEQLAREKHIDARCDALVDEYARTPKPNEVDKDMLTGMMLLTYNLAVYTRQLSAAVASTALIADIHGHRVHRTEIGSPDEFARARTKDDYVAVIERKMGKDHAAVFKEMLERLDKRPVEGRLIEGGSNAGTGQNGLPDRSEDPDRFSSDDDA